MTVLYYNADMGETLYDRVKDLIGSVHLGDPYLSEDAGRKVSEMLNARTAADAPRRHRPDGVARGFR